MRREGSPREAFSRRGKVGLTLIEMLIAVTLLGLVAGSFAYLYGISQRFMIQSVNISSSQGEAAFALEHIQRHLQLATGVALPANVGDAGPALDFTWQPTTADLPRNSRYRLVGTDLQFIADTKNVGAGTSPVIARNIVAITFTRTTQSTVEIKVQAEWTDRRDTRETTLRTTVSPRGLF